MPLTDYHDMVQTFASNRANHALGIGVLPRRSWRFDRLPDVQHLGLTRKSVAIDLVPIPDQIPRAVLRPARLEQLARRPFGSRMLRDIKMHQPTPAVGQHNEHEQDSKGRGRYREEIQRNEIRSVVLQECSPPLRRRPPRRIMY